MKRMIVLAILAVLALGALAVFTPTTSTAGGGGPCLLCKPRICGPCEVYTGDTCLSCGTCRRIPGCHP